ncbi:MAG: flagellar filament capping protein FliD, partial [Candidatus Latescibacteria bacterium]|nr:flagellar filament capping protein FliD [Candidatus Latescibacterota bacterium]
MAGSVNFGGMVSGLDTSKIIEDLIMVDSKPLRRLENRQTDFTKKRDTFTTIKTDLLDLKNKAFELKTASSFGVFSASSSDEEALSVSASTSANEGNYSLKILSLAEAETLSGNSYEDTGNDLGLSGEILINNKSFEISSNDSLIDVRNGINALDAGVKASILKVTDNNNRLIISAETSGADKILIANVGETDILGELGLTDGTKSVRKIESGTVYSAEYTSAHSTIGSLLDLSSEVSGTVNIRNKSLSFNLGTDTLSTIRDKINDFGPGGVSASVESVTTDDATVYRLAITGTEDFADDNNILESLGILTGGTSGTYTEFQTGSLSYTDDEIVYADTNTKLTGLGAIISETITISGKNTDGSSVSDTINIENNTKISNVLSSIEEAFGNNVSASIQGGIISVVSNSAGSNYLEFGIRAGNELGGNIDFGTVSTVTEGRERLLVEGTDARILVNNIEISRDTNEINDALTGLSLTLKKVDPETELTITVERDFDVVREKIEDFVNSYNEFIDYVNENTKYDKENNIPGLLTGDNTTRSIVSRIRNAMSSTVFNHDINFNQLVQIGIESNIEGKLEIDTAKLNDALGEDIDSVISLFSTTRTTSDNDISFVYHSNKSKQGTYDVSITQAAERATAVSQAIEGEVGESGFITIADNYDNSMAVEYSADMTLDDISNSFNAEAQNTYAEIQQSSAILP